MRKITQQTVTAFLRGKARAIDNTRVANGRMNLLDSLIACVVTAESKWRPGVYTTIAGWPSFPRPGVYISNAGLMSNTTIDRLNGIIESYTDNNECDIVRIWQGKWYWLFKSNIGAVLPFPNNQFVRIGDSPKEYSR